MKYKYWQYDSACKAMVCTACFMSFSDALEFSSLREYDEWKIEDDKENVVERGKWFHSDPKEAD